MLRNRATVFCAAIMGNILEYYDFTVYIVFSIEIGKAFFPSNSPLTQILGSLGGFAFGFLARPIGGIFLGRLGDSFGRKAALLCSALGMTISTFAIGFLPSYASIGVTATVLLMLFRLVQGFCISGEGTGTAIFVLEHYGIKKPGLISGIVHSTNVAGTLLAALVALSMKTWIPHSKDTWRLAFALGGILGTCALYLRLRVSETPIFKISQKQKLESKQSAIKILRSRWKQMLLASTCAALASSLVQFVKGYVNIYCQDILKLSDWLSLSYLIYASVILMASMIIFGALTDKLGKAKVLIWSGIMSILLSFPSLLLMSGASLMQHILALTILSMVAGAASASAYAFVITLFRPSQRFFGVSVSYNLGIAIFGGTSPLISRWLVDLIGKDYAPAYYTVGVALLFLAVAFQMKSVFLKPKINP